MLMRGLCLPPLSLCNTFVSSMGLLRAIRIDGCYGDARCVSEQPRRPANLQLAHLKFKFGMRALELQSLSRTAAAAAAAVAPAEAHGEHQVVSSSCSPCRRSASACSYVSRRARSLDGDYSCPNSRDMGPSMFLS